MTNTDMREAFEKDYPEAKKLILNPLINKYEYTEDDGSRWTHAINHVWKAYQLGWQASRQQPIVLPNPSGFSDMNRRSFYAYRPETIKAAITAQGYAVKESDNG